VLLDGRLVTCGRPAQLVTATGSVRVRFSCPAGDRLEGLARLPGVGAVGYDGEMADVCTDPAAVVELAGELARRRLAPADFTVIRPFLEDAVVSLLNGGSR
jgi:hypothetical protein